MSNTEWKKGYEEGFAAGWKAAKEKSDTNYTNFPPVYFGGSGGNMAYTVNPPGSYAINTMNDTLPSSYTTDTVTIKGATNTIRNLTDHTRIV